MMCHIISNDLNTISLKRKSILAFQMREREKRATHINKISLSNGLRFVAFIRENDLFISKTNLELGMNHSIGEMSARIE